MNGGVVEALLIHKKFCPFRSGIRRHRRSPRFSKYWPRPWGSPWPARAHLPGAAARASPAAARPFWWAPARRAARAARPPGIHRAARHRDGPGARRPALEGWAHQPQQTSAANNTAPTGQAKLLARSSISGCFHSGTSVTGVTSTWNGVFIRLTESPRSLLKPMVSRTSAVICSSCSGVSALATVLPLSSADW
jgi:hypothetical protein